MRIRHHFPRPIGKRHPIFWAPFTLGGLMILAGIALLALMLLLYISPLTLVYGLSTFVGHKVAIHAGTPPGTRGLSTIIEVPSGIGPNLVGSYKTLHWAHTNELVLTDVKVGDFFVAKTVRLAWSWRYVFSTRRLSLIDLDHPEVFIGKLKAAFPDDPSAPAAAPSDPFDTIRHIFYKIRIDHGIVWLDNLAAGMPALPLSIGRQEPIEWTTGSLTKVNAQEQIKFATLTDITLYSPINALAKVLDLGTVKIGFTWHGLENQEIESVSIDGPSIYIGPALFDFASAFKNASASSTPAATAASPTASTPTPAPGSPPPKEWVLHNFVINKGQLDITAFGEPGLELPFTFHASAQNLGLAHFDQLSLTSAIVIEKHTYNYPSYGLNLTNLSGKIFFSLPLSDPHANNLNQTIQMDAASWKEVEVTNARASVTFDKEGIYGDIWANAYGGYVTGDYYVQFDNGFPWHAGLYITDAEVGDVIEKFAKKNFSLRGKTRMSFSVDAHERQIDRSEAKVTFPHGGTMEIPSVDELLTKLPADWGDDQRAIAANILGSFRDYTFTTGKLDLRYGVPTATMQLNLEGNQGARNFVINWTQEGEKEGVVLPKKTPPRVSIQLNKKP